MPAVNRQTLLRVEETESSGAIGSSSTLVGLITGAPPLAPSVPILEAYQAFSADPHLYALAVVDEHRAPVGIINRFRFLERLSQPFGRDLLARQPVAKLMDPRPLIVDEGVGLDGLNEMLLDDRTRYVFDGFIVTRQGRYLGVGTGHALMRRLTERRHAQLSHLAFHDPLTDLPNRQLFHDRLHQALASASRNHRRLAVLYIDLDRFKAVNDTLGHAAGDELLVRASDRFRTLVRAQDTVARLSGDEFAVLVTELGQADDASVVAKKVIDLFRHPFLLDGRDVLVSCSVGAVVFPDHTESQVALMRMADDALYRAKRSRNRFEHYSPDMARSSSIGPLVFDTVRRAIDRSHLEVLYQPQANIRTGTLRGLEALVRWHDPARGVVPTPELIRLAEDTGLISEITDYVSRVALTQLREWRRRGLAHGVRMALNVSGTEVRDGVLEPMLAEHLAATELPFSALDVEITESAIMDSDSSATGVLTRLRRAGARVSVDDFGTGYSSLARLQRLPVDALKIDKAFVERVGSDARDSALARAVISMAHSLGLSVVAEGVETEQQYAFLREQACDAYQGYLLARPLPASEVEVLLEQAAETRAS